MEGGMAQRAPKGSMKQVSRPILIYLSPRSPNNNHQQPLKNDLHFGGLLRGMLRGYASGYASGVCFARAPPSTNTYLGPREKTLTHIYIYIHVNHSLLPWLSSGEHHDPLHAQPFRTRVRRKNAEAKWAFKAHRTRTEPRNTPGEYPCKHHHVYHIIHI